MIDFVLYVHLPGVRIAEDCIPFANGELVHLDYADWYRLDGTHEFAETAYTHTRPLFWRGECHGDEPTALALCRAHALHRIFLLHPRAPAVTAPGLSTLYVEFDREEFTSWNRIVGFAEREWIVFGGVATFDFDAQDLAHLADIGALLEEVPEERWPGPLAAALDTLERTARPEYVHVDLRDGAAAAFVSLIAACEGIVTERSAPSGASLTDAFVHRLAGLIPIDEALRDAYRSDLGKMYRLRSKLVHGRIALADLDLDQRLQLRKGRLLLRNAIIASLSELAPD